MYRKRAPLPRPAKIKEFMKNKRIKSMSKLIKVLAIDPGEKGALIVTDGKKIFNLVDMPTEVYRDEKIICAEKIFEIMITWNYNIIILERAKPMGQGMKQAFNYGKGFALIENVCREISKQENIPLMYIDPSVWAKEMHKEEDPNMKPKFKSLMAVKRIYPHLVDFLPKIKTGKSKGQPKDGFIDALLMAGYQLGKINTAKVTKLVIDDVGDFF